MWATGVNSKFCLKVFYYYALFNNVNISFFSGAVWTDLSSESTRLGFERDHCLDDINTLHSFLVLHGTGTAMIAKTKNHKITFRLL